MDNDKYVLAMYDVRGKQDFIYATNKIKEIVGASEVIRDIFKDYLLRAADRYALTAGFNKGIYMPGESDKEDHAEPTKTSDKEKFSLADFKKRVEKKLYLGEVVYNGGGNFFTLFADRKAYIETTKRFTEDVLQNIGSLYIQSWCHETDLTDYVKDRNILFREYKAYSAHETFIHPVNTLPIVQVDPMSSQPYVEFSPFQYMDELKNGERKTKVARAQYAKLKKYKKNHSKDEAGKFLDDLVAEKGSDSLLAVIYIDGNSMGAKVQNCLNSVKENPSAGTNLFEASINALRKFSAQLNDDYVTKPVQAIDQMLEEKTGDKKDTYRKRVVIAAGDEITIICRASLAMEAVKTYFDMQNQLNRLDQKNKENKDEMAIRSSCAGIAIFHSHAPFADAYRIAEACCESGKQWMKEHNIKNAQMVDFHYCQTGFGASLEKIRENENYDGISLPWYYGERKSASGERNGFSFSYEKSYTDSRNMAVNCVLSYLQTMGHSNVKRLLRSSYAGMGELKTELLRIDAHAVNRKKGIQCFADLKNQTAGLGVDEDALRYMIRDIVTVYDIWFAKEETE